MTKNEELDALQPRRDLLTVAVEDYFQVVAFKHLIRPAQWYRFESRIERNTYKTLELLDEFDVRATFFALGWVADEMPEVIRAIVDRGHEIATKGYYHRTIQQMTRGEFREDLLRSKEALERAAGRRIRGHRVARGHFGLSDLWALDVLAEEGFAYDSSMYPRLRQIAEEPWRRFAHVHRHRDRELWEFPMATRRVAGLLLPLGGGAYFRQLPHGFVQRSVERWHQRYDAPFVMYFHIWELDPELPEITAAGPLTRMRQYRNLDKMSSLLRYYLSHYPFTSIAEHLGLVTERAEAPPVPPPSAETTERIEVQQRTPVTIVVPCFNEEGVLGYLSNTLKRVEAELGRRYELHFVFVDDGSTDKTWDALHKTFGSLARCRIVRHEKNRGVAAAILTGIEQAETEIVCSIDCDCTYDPRQLRELIPMLTQDVAVVTASPYHTSGRVLNVPSWRLALSRGLSALYRLVFRQKLATYTSCFRVYRRSALLDLPIRERGFLGVAEMLGVLDARGQKIAECPAVLEVRMLGRSKMKLLETIAGHLRLLVRLAAGRLRRGSGRDGPHALPSA